MTSKLDSKILIEMGLNPERIEEHQRRIVLALAGKLETHIPVQSECSTENGGLVSLEHLNSCLNKVEKPEFEKWLGQHVASLIPAAGAASRHFKDVHAFVKTCEQNTAENIKPHHGLNEWAHVFENQPHLSAARLYQKILKEQPHPVAKLSTHQKSYAAAKALAETFGNEPKALVETTSEGDDFLDLKILEQHRIFPVAKNFLIVSAGKQAVFSKILNEKIKKHEVPANWFTTEQGLDLSTIRFQPDGSPVLGDDGKSYSIVSAGHGELVHVMSTLAKNEPAIECIHVRNVDNVIGASKPVQGTMSTLANSFFQISQALQTLRRFALENQVQDVLDECVQALQFLRSIAGLPAAFNQKEFLLELHRMGEKLFGWSTTDNVTAALARPLSLMAMIAREPADVGGGPVFAKLHDQHFKICLETPHASPADYETFFSETGRMKHFNPGFVFFEARNTATQKPVEASALYDSRFWLLSKKDYQGKTVYYHETVLYELIGNAARNNVIFVDVPRHIFHPHKAVFDSLHQSRTSYGF